MRLYKQYVRPHLVFASLAWSPWLQGEKDVLEKGQEKAVKMVSGLKTTTYLERCDELTLETLEKRRLVQVWHWYTSWPMKKYSGIQEYSSLSEKMLGQQQE
jgi:hypothetical protein